MLLCRRFFCARRKHTIHYRAAAAAERRERGVINLSRNTDEHRSLLSHPAAGPPAGRSASLLPPDKLYTDFGRSATPNITHHTFLYAFSALMLRA